MIIEEIIAIHAIDAYLFRLGSTNPEKNPAPGFFFAFISGAYCRGAFDLEPLKTITFHEFISFENVRALTSRYLLENFEQIFLFFKMDKI